MRRYLVNFGFRISKFGIGLKTHEIPLILILSMAIATGCAKKEEEVTPTPTGPTIVGVVKSEGKPLEGVTVSIEALGISSTTGSDGSFKMTDLVEGAYKVSFEKEGYVKKEVEVTVGAEGTVNIGEVVLELSGSIEGIAKIEGEEVHKGIKVRVMELEGLEAETDSEGRYTITGVPSGSYTLELSASGFDPKQISVDVVGGKTTTAEEVTFKGRKFPGMESLILYYAFEPGDIAGAIVKDRSPKKNNGNIVGNPTIADGKVGKAMQFNGTSDYIEIPHNDSLNCIDGVTIAAWINYTGTGDTWQTIVSKGPMSGTYENYACFINIVGGFAGIAEPFIHFVCSVEGTRYWFNSAGGEIAPNKWSYVVSTFDGTEWRNYVDGKLATSGSQPGKLTPNTFSLRVGHREGSSHYWSGLLDEVMVFNRALKEDEVKLLCSMMGVK